MLSLQNDNSFKMVLSITISLVVVFLTIVFLYYKWQYQYWRRKNLPYLEPHIPYGNITNPLRRKQNIAFTFKEIYNKIKKKNWKHAGVYFFFRPVYFVTDLDYIKNILTKDFQYFTDRGIYYNEKDDPLSAHLASISGSKWRNMRTKLTPTFTSGKMKMMFQTLVDCEANLLKKMDSECEKKHPINIKEILACFTTDIIGSCAFGLDCKTFEQDNSPFRIYGKRVFNMSRLDLLIRNFAASFPNLALKMGVVLTPKDITEFFMNIVKDTIDYREKNNVTRNDFMQLLINMKNSGDNEALTIEEVAAQSFVFFLAGFETSSTTMTFALYELAKNQDIQQKLRDEINRVLANYQGKITYEAINDMKYLDQVVNETLRKHPPAPMTARKCTKDYKIPDEDIVIEKGTTVMIPIMGIHHDEEYYPNPEKFDPERFSDENKNSRHHYTHIPFGEGPRICIGMRFGLVQSKVGLTSLIKNYNFTVNEKTPEPLVFNTNTNILTVEGDVWLNAQKI